VWCALEAMLVAMAVVLVLCACAGTPAAAEDEATTAAARVRAAFHAHIRELARRMPESRITDAFPRSRDQWLAHSETVRHKLRTTFHFPPRDVPLEPRTVATIDRGDFVIEKLVYRVEADNWVTASLYRPRHVPRPAPAFVCPCGHGGSKSAAYNQYFGQMYALAGCLVLVPDPIGEEERDERHRLAVRGHRRDHRIDRCLELGISTIGKMVYDITRGIDYLVSRREVDRDRIGCAGHSLGGTLTEYVTAVDRRVRLSLPTAWTCHFAEIVGDPSCCWRPVGLLRVAGDPELFALGAPHCATLVLAGGADACPMHVSLFQRTTLPAAKRVYELFGRGECLAVHVTPKAGHHPFQINRAALAWVEKHFDLPGLTAEQIARLGPPPPPDELRAELPVPFKDKSWTAERIHLAGAAGFPVRLLSPEALRCLKPGEEAKPQYGMAGWVVARERRLAAPFVVPEGKAALEARRREVAERVRELLRLPARPEDAAAETVRAFRHGHAAARELRYGLLGLSSFLLVPDGARRPPVAIVLDRSRTKEGALRSPRVAKLLAEGTAVLAIDCVGFEETTHLLGTSPTAYNVCHVLESVDALSRLTDVDASRLACIGEVDDVAPLAAFLDQRIARVVVASKAGTPVSWQRYRWHGIVPGLRAVPSFSPSWPLGPCVSRSPWPTAPSSRPSTASQAPPAGSNPSGSENSEKRLLESFLQPATFIRHNVLNRMEMCRCRAIEAKKDSRSLFSTPGVFFRESVEVLCRLAAVDASQLACIGEVDDVAPLAALLDQRIARVVVASKAGTPVSWQRYRWHGIVPGLRAVASRAELLALLAPRPLRLEIAVADRAKLQAIYRLAGAADRLQPVR